MTYRRQVFASGPDDVIVLHFTQDGGGRYSGDISLDGTHGEATTGTRSGRYASFGAQFANGLRYGAAVTAYGSGGTVAVVGARISFRNCRGLTVIVAGGTNYAPDPATGYRAPSLDPRRLARGKVLDAAEHSAATLLHTHVADHRELFERMDVSLGTSSPLQRGMDTWERIGARHTDDTPDPELEAA